MSTAAQEHPLQLTTAYSVCRSIARSAAKNFYYGFMVLPQARRNALCAVYAFMRHADDIADDPTMSLADRHAKLTEFIDSYHRVCDGAPTDDPVFMALRESQQRYAIPTELLDKLVAGTMMDVSDPRRVQQPGVLTVDYRTFDELYGYCYHVASVVGLVCIRIFGYRDPKAEIYAEQLGVAFQLTNILRDVREDAEMGRIYIPQVDLDHFGVTPEVLANGKDSNLLQPLLAFEVERAKEFYKSADMLMPLIEDVSQPALWTLVNIYRGILDRIEQRGYDVYSERVRLTTAEKVGVLAKGFWRRLT